MPVKRHALAAAVAVLHIAALAAAQDCSRYNTFQAAWSKAVDPSTDAATRQRLMVEFDPRKLNTDDIKGCTPAVGAQGMVAVSAAATPLAWPSTEYNYADYIRGSLYFYECQRSGTLPPPCTTRDNPTVSNLDCARPSWRANSALGDASGQDLTGGYYDAGDHVKFGLPLAVSMGQLALGLLEFPEGYQAAGEYQRGLRTLKWALDYMVKGHNNADPTVFIAQVGDGYADHSYWGRPENMTMNRPAFYVSASAPGTDIWSASAAALAGGAALYKTVNPTLSNNYLTHAVQLYNAAKNSNKAVYSQSVANANDFYKSSGWEDDLATAAAMLYEATLDNTYLNEAVTFYNNWVNTGKGWEGFDWDNNQWIATYILQKRQPSHQNSRTKYEGFITAWLNKARTAKVYSYPGCGVQGLAWLGEWASLRAANAAAFMFQLYMKTPALANDPVRQARLSCWAQTQVRYTLGDAGRSFIVGYGSTPPVRPHHRAASCPSPMSVNCDWNNFNSAAPNPQVLFGALVGGPRDLQDTYNDARNDYVANEVGIEYNSAYTGSLAALLTRRAQYSTTCSCMCNGNTQCNGGTSCPLNWLSAGATAPASPAPTSPATPPPSPPSQPPAPPSPSPKVPSPAPTLPSPPPTVGSPSPKPPSPSPSPKASSPPVPSSPSTGDCNPGATIVIPPWGQCGGKGGLCPSCSDRWCDSATCASRDAVWPNTRCGNIGWNNAPTVCCRQSEWYYQCVERPSCSSGLCGRVGAVARAAALQNPSPYVTEAESRQRRRQSRNRAYRAWKASQSRNTTEPAGP